MYQYNIENTIRTILETWITLIQLDKNKTTNEVLLVDKIYQLFNCICNLLYIDGQYILDIWEDNNYNIDTTIDYIIKNNYEVVESNIEGNIKKGSIEEI